MITNKKQVLIADGLFHVPTDENDNACLIGSRCTKCERSYFPTRPVCPVCSVEGSMKETKLSNRGKIVTYSIARIPMPGFPAPYIQAYIDLDNEGPRVFSLITNCEPKEGALKIGDEVEMVIDKITEDDCGSDVIGYKFRPVTSFKL